MSLDSHGSSRGSIRQIAFYLAFGFAQLGIDWALFAGLTLAGLPIGWSNLISRLAAAMVGYLLNGAVTFRSNGAGELNRRALIRYLTLWIALTALSTILVSVIGNYSNAGTTRLAKPAVEAFLAVISFITMKFWVYRRPVSGRRAQDRTDDHGLSR